MADNITATLDEMLDAANMQEEEEVEHTNPEWGEDSDFPEGTVLKLTVRKYLWAVTGAMTLEVPVGCWDDIDSLVEAWYDFQQDLVEEYQDELDAVYNRPDDGPRRPKPRRQSTQSNTDEIKRLRGVAFGIGTKKGVRVMDEWPDFMQMGEEEINAVIEDLKRIPGRDAASEATSRVRKARSSRRRR